MKQFWKDYKEYILGLLILGTVIPLMFSPMLISTVTSDMRRAEHEKAEMDWEKKKYLGEKLEIDCIHSQECEAYKEFLINLRKELIQ